MRIPCLYPPSYALSLLAYLALWHAPAVIAQPPTSRSEPTARAGITLTEEQLIAALRDRDAVVRHAQVMAAAEEARGRAVGAHPNPSVSWEREDLGSAVDREDTLTLSIPIALGGTRFSERARAMGEGAMSRAELALQRSARVTEALEFFYRGIAAEKAALIAAERLERLEEAERVLTRRFEEGSASGYEKSRMSLALEAARHANFQANQAHRQYLLAFAPLFDEGDEVQALDGTLSVDPATQAEARSASAHLSPSERATQDATEYSRDAQHAASWAFVPTIELTGGFKRASGATEATGYLAGVSLELPLFNHGQEARANAEQMRLRIARVAERRRQARATEKASAEMKLRSLTAEEARFNNATREHAARIVTAAESGYREGTVSIVELLDAHQARTDNERQALAISLELKLAELALRASRGDFEQ